MGYGGNLIFTSVFKALNERDGLPIVVCHKPGLSDLLAGRLYDGAVSLADDEIFRSNPRLRFTEARPKSALARLLDAGFRALQWPNWIKKPVERAIFRASERRAARDGERLFQIDMLIHIYAERQVGKPATRGRMIWKAGGHAADTIARSFGLDSASRDCELCFTAEERDRVIALRAAEGLEGRYLVVEPGTNRDWFGDLRAWPIDRWQQVVDRFRERRPDLPIAQAGLLDEPLLDGVVDLRGKTSFREAALLLEDASLFVGTESGLMHAANAVGARALILWGGITLPSFAGYPDRQHILHHPVPCAGCGNLGWCDNDHVCMRSITVEEVLSAMAALTAPAQEAGQEPVARSG